MQVPNKTNSADAKNVRLIRALYIKVLQKCRNKIDQCFTGGDQWKLRTREKVRLGDPTIYALLTNPEYKLPTVLPDGNYSAQTFMIQPNQ